MNTFENTFLKHRRLMLESLNITEAIPLMLSPEQQKEFAKDYKNNMPYASICKKYNMSYATVRNYLKRLNLVGKKTPPKDVPAETELAVIEKLKSGMTLKQISLEFGITVPKVVSILKKNDIQTNIGIETRKLSPEQEKELIYLYHTGVRAEDLVNIFKISLKGVYRTIHRGNAEILPPRRALTPDEESVIYNGYLDAPKKTEYINQIAVKYNVTPRSIYRTIVRKKKSSPQNTSSDPSLQNYVDNLGLEEKYGL